MMTLGGHHDVLGLKCRHWIIRMWSTFKLLRCEIYVLQNVFCVQLERGEM